MKWEITPEKKLPKLHKPILIEGLPGIGNVGKIAADFLADEIGAKKLFDIFSYDLPNSVFVNEKGLVELPLIEVYHKKVGTRDILILTGDIQPSEERSSYEFCEEILRWFTHLGGKEIVALGGIGLAQLPKKPQVYITGTNKTSIDTFSKGLKVQKNIYGVVGPIVGVTGLLVGLSPRFKIDAYCLLAETFNHPAYLGLKSAREIIHILDKKYKFNINFKSLDKEIDELQLAVEQAIEPPGIKKKIKRLKGPQHETSYIG